ncbi:MAG TPA: FtsX-like permease family protein [Clostridiales bacterium]|nr:FtsX-like permease family protein [Clostridiales bacterium]
MKKMKNNNTKIIGDLSRGSMRKNRMRNFFAILAIALTSVLFTVTFTLTAGVMKSIESDTMRQVGTTAHAGFKDLTKEQYEVLSGNEQIKDESYNIFFSTATNPKLQKRSVEMRYTEAKAFTWTQTKLTAGHLPETGKEVVLDTFTLEALNIPAKLGQKVTLSWEILSKEYEDTFTLCGYYSGDPLSMASEVYFSKEYVNQLLSIRTEQEWYALNNDTNGVGLIQMDAVYANSWDIEGRTKEIIKECGYRENEIDYGINWGYLSTGLSSIDPASGILIAGVLLIILISGYLMIYNIFYISIVEDIRFYGLLKTIGTTRKQIKKLIYRQANTLSLIGIPLGLLAGWLLGNTFLPLTLSMLSGDVESHISFNPLIFLFSIFFTMATIRISCRKPGKMAATISPVEAVKFERIGEKRKQKKQRRQSHRNTVRKNASGNLNYVVMAWRNLKRDRKKSGLVITSMSLSILLFVLIATITSSFSVEKYASSMLGNTDLYLTSAAMQVNGYYGEGDTDIEDRLQTFASYLDSLGLKDETKISKLLLYEDTIAISGDAANRYKKAYDAGLIKAHDENDTYTIERIKKTLAGEAGLEISYYGFDYDILKNLTVTDGTLDKAKYESGNHIVFIKDQDDEDDNISLNLGSTLYKVGDQITIKGKTYEVMAFVEIPYTLSKQSYSFNGMFGILPREEVENIAQLQGETENCSVYGAAVNVTAKNKGIVEKAVAQYTDSIDTSLVYQSKNIITKEFDGLRKMIVIIGGALAAMIGLIAIMNYINSIITGIITRKREFAMMTSIGMEKRQLMKVLYAESGAYCILAWLISSIFGILIAQSGIKSFCSNMTWLSYQFPVWAVMVTLPVLILLSFAVPYFSYRRLRKESAVEALREE